MRWLFLLPACVLLLSNIPFIREMKKVSVAIPVTQVTKKCCSKMAGNKTSCAKAAIPAPPPQGSKKTCTRSAESCCVCITCFQYAAPEPAWRPFHVDAPSIIANYTGFLPSIWKNLPRRAPWQPPDFTI